MVDIYVKIETGVNSTFTLLTALTHIDAAVIALTIQTEVKVMVVHEYQYWENEGRPYHSSMGIVLNIYIQDYYLCKYGKE